ncbi:hypothetical protein [Leisingera aquaemixtae]|uniref:hypothetical protein n=1 Tax=Leisingera aquaemixtae TaxID=1396826 RepID=UPI0021A6D020|nr:hypothetical protein [Leisingera aquaemixtae]UWQ46869.1 hypothetical protein K3719_05765 [Leisingera aquaemixtae]
MSKQHDEPLSPTVTKVLDAYLDALKGDSDIAAEAATRLDTLLRQGKVPKPADIDAALFPPEEDEGAS